MNKRQKKKVSKQVKDHVAKMLAFAITNDSGYVKEYSDSEIKGSFKKIVEEK